MRQWKHEICKIHLKQTVLCPCQPPVGYRVFYAQTKSETEQQIWKENLNLEFTSWNNHKIVCSAHFIDRCPTAENPYPVLNCCNDAKKAKKRLLNENSSIMEVKRSKADQQITIEQENGTENHTLIANLKLRIKQLEETLKTKDETLKIKEEQIQQLQNNSDALKFNAKNLLKNKETFKFYTGITPELFTAVFGNISPYTEGMRYWRGPGKGKENQKRFGAIGMNGRRQALLKEDQFLLWLIRCRLNLKLQDLAFRFSVSMSVVSSIFITWTKFLRPILEKFIIWPSRETISQNLPNKFKDFPNTRAIIDCFELGINHPKSLKAQAETYSNYKSTNTLKYLIAITPNAACSFVSKGFGGRTSDQKITAKSGLVEKFEEGDDCMADRGFDIGEILKVKGATLNIPPKTNGKKQLTENEVTKTRRIASARIYVENYIGRLRNFTILKEKIPITCVRHIDDVVVCLCALCNLSPGLNIQ